MASVPLTTIVMVRAALAGMSKVVPVRVCSVQPLVTSPTSSKSLTVTLPLVSDTAKTGERIRELDPDRVGRLSEKLASYASIPLLLRNTTVY